MSILNTIDEPQQLRALSLSQLSILAKECRCFLKQSLNQTGGHYGASLGVVELTIALHYCFDTPNDIIVWDVGHQAYVHKLLTQRRDYFQTLRQPNGLLPFPSRSESPYDSFGTGHAGTAVSATLGFALAAQYADPSRQHIAVVGDGALTCGETYEAINHAATTQSNLLIIINDNGMSITPNVGGIKHVSTDTSNALRLYQSLGVNYIGCIDGHDLTTLTTLLTEQTRMTGVRLLVVKTQKGKGDPLAEKDELNLHAVKPGFADKNAHQPPLTKTQTLSQTFGLWAQQTLSDDSNAWVISAATLEGAHLMPCRQQFPSRCLDVGIAEQHALTLAAGLAASGQKPIVSMYATFLQRGLDQVIHDIALQNLDVTLAIDRAGLVGADSATHHGIYELAMLLATPNLTIAEAATSKALKQLLHLAYQNKGPWVIRYAKSIGLTLTQDPPIKLHQAVAIKSGDNTAILSYGEGLKKALKQAQHTDATVVDLRFLKPLDWQMIDDIASRHNNITVIEPVTANAGVGHAIATYLLQKNWTGTFNHDALDDRFYGCETL